MAKRVGAEETDIIRHIERVGPHHAQGLQHLAGISLAGRQGDSFDHFRIDFELNCGTAQINVSDKILLLSLKICHVDLRRENCDVIPNSRHQAFLGESEVEDQTISKNSKTNDHEIDVKGEGSIALSIFSIVGKFTGLVKGSKSVKKSQVTQQQLKMKSRLDLVVAAGQDRWRIGDPELGDARRKDRRLFGSYCGEPQKKGDDPRPLCALSRRAKNQDVTVTAVVSAPLAQIVIETEINSTKCTPTVHAEMDTKISQRGERLRKTHENELMKLKQRVAGLVIGKELRDRQLAVNLAPPEGEVILGAVSILVPSGSKIQPSG